MVHIFPDSPWRMVKSGVWAASGFIQSGSSCLASWRSSGPFFASVAASSLLSEGGTMTDGNSPFPLCRKMNRMGGWPPVGFAHAARGVSARDVAPRAAVAMKSRRVVMVSSPVFCGR